MKRWLSVITILAMLCLSLVPMPVLAAGEAEGLYVESYWIDYGADPYSIQNDDGDLQSSLDMEMTMIYTYRAVYVDAAGNRTALTKDKLTVPPEIRVTEELDDWASDENRPSGLDKTYLNLFGLKAGNYAISYKTGGKTFTLPIRVSLPEVALYTAPSADDSHIVLDEWEYTGPEKPLYLVVTGDASIKSAAFEDGVEKGTITIAADKKSAAVSVEEFENGCGYISCEVTLAKGGSDITEYCSVNFKDMRPGLLLYTFYWDENGKRFRWEDSAVREITGTPNDYMTYQVVFFDGENEKVLGSADLNAPDFVTLRDLKGEQEGEISFLLNDFGKGDITCTAGGKTYTLPVSCELPEIGLYSGPAALEANYLSEWDYTGPESTVYLAPKDGAQFVDIREVRLDEEEDQTPVSLTLSADKKSAALTLSEYRNNYSIDFEGNLKNADGETEDFYCSFIVNDRTPAGVMPLLRGPVMDESWELEKETEYRIDADGRETKVSDYETANTYDADGRLIKNEETYRGYYEEGEFTSKMVTEFDGDGKPVKQTITVIQNGEVTESNTWTGDEINHDDGGAVYTHDDNGNLLSTVWPDGTQYDFTYDANNHMLSEMYTGSDGAVYEKTMYAYDTDGRLLTVSSNSDHSPSVYTLQYDGNGVNTGFLYESWGSAFEGIYTYGPASEDKQDVTLTVYYVGKDGVKQPMRKMDFTFVKSGKASNPVNPPQPKQTFTDVQDANQYYYAPVYWAVDKGITNGISETQFAPDATCTRGQIVTFLWRAKGEPAPKTAKNPFKDVKEGDYFYRAVLWAVENGITTGTGDDTFSPDDPCTRGQVATFLWRTEGEPKVEGANPFDDVRAGEYYYNAVLWAVQKEITNGTGDRTFDPMKPCTRGQIVTFLYRALG